jgi:hypothetical protein
MYAKVALLLISFTLGAFGESCTCGGLKACIDQKTNRMQRSHDKCAFQCRKKLPGNNEKVQECIEDKQYALTKLNDNQIDCLLNPSMGVCVAPRARRQSDSNNFFVQLSASDFQPASNRGKWIQAGAEAQPETSINGGIDVEQLLQPYNDCMDKCIQDIRQEKGEGLASGETVQAVDPMGRHLATIQECQLTEQCTVNLAALAEAAGTTSCQSDRTDVFNFKQDIKQSLCRCVRGALQKSDSEMPC